MKKLQRHINLSKVPAFTLFESVVAISIIAILTGIGTMVYANVLKAENPVVYYQVQNEIEQRFQELKQSKLFFDQEFESETYRIMQKIVPYQGNEKLLEVSFTAFSGSEIIVTEQYLMVNEEEEK